MYYDINLIERSQTRVAVDIESSKNFKDIISLLNFEKITSLNLRKESQNLSYFM